MTNENIFCHTGRKHNWIYSSYTRVQQTFLTLFIFYNMIFQNPVQIFLGIFCWFVIQIICSPRMMRRLQWLHRHSLPANWCIFEKEEHCTNICVKYLFGLLNRSWTAYENTHEFSSCFTSLIHYQMVFSNWCLLEKKLSVCSLTVRPNHVSRKTKNSYHVIKQLNDVTVTHTSAQTTFKSSWKLNTLKGGHVFRGKSLSNLPFICPIHCAAKALTSIKI